MIEFPEDEEFCVISSLSQVNLRLTSGTLVGDDIILEGRLEVRQRFSGKWLEWIPAKPLVNVANGDGQMKTSVEMDRSSYHRHRVTFDLRDLLSFSLTLCPRRDSWDKRQVVFMLKDGTTHAPVEFNVLHEPAFMKLIRDFVNLRQSMKDSSLYLVTDLDTARVDRVTRAISEGQALTGWEQPYDRLMDGLSKVTAFLRTNVVEPSDDDEELEQLIAEDRGNTSLVDTSEESDYVLVQPLHSPIQTGQNNFIEPEVLRTKQLSMTEVCLMQDSEGRFINKDEVLERIFRGEAEAVDESEGTEDDVLSHHAIPHRVLMSNISRKIQRLDISVLKFIHDDQHATFKH